MLAQNDVSEREAIVLRIVALEAEAQARLLRAVDKRQEIQAAIHERLEREAAAERAAQEEQDAAVAGLKLFVKPPPSVRHSVIVVLES
jgi:hypothetical protein